MFVQYQLPAAANAMPPVVMIHGRGQSGANFLSTADGRPGWASDFVAAGYATYVVDQVARGRSGQFDDYGPYNIHSTDHIQGIFTGTDVARRWPKAALQSQWPGGSGVAGNPTCDEFMSSQIPSLADNALTERLNTAALIALLERIGPAVLITHSQSAPFGWLVADARPELVPAILAVEPGGAPFHDVHYVGAPDYFAESPTLDRPWGLTRNPLAFDPPIADFRDLKPRKQAAPDMPGTIRGWLPEAKGRLPGLAQVPVAVVTGEASYHSAFEHLVCAFLARFGVAVEHFRLEEHGLPGNGHMIMMERNSREVAGLMMAWLERRLR
jgi:pimeloyl-ACP methyl ester carboxylesterase